MKNLILLISITLFTYSTTAQNKSKILKEYISIKNELVKSDNKAASKAITVFYQGLKNEKDFAQKEAIIKATEKLVKASSLEKQRSAFHDVSVQTWKLVKSSNDTDKVVYYQYCPMKKTNWLSFEKEIKNPYYGSSMLTCGNVIETKK